LFDVPVEESQRCHGIKLIIEIIDESEIPVKEPVSERVTGSEVKLTFDLVIIEKFYVFCTGAKIVGQEERNIYIHSHPIACFRIVPGWAFGFFLNHEIPDSMKVFVSIHRSFVFNDTVKHHGMRKYTNTRF